MTIPGPKHIASKGLRARHELARVRKSCRRFHSCKQDHSLRASTERMASFAPNPTTIGKQIRRGMLITEERASQLCCGALHERHSLHDAVRNLFRVGRHLLRSSNHRLLRSRSLQVPSYAQYDHVIMEMTASEQCPSKIF
jgi:hypothetical protein